MDLNNNQKPRKKVGIALSGGFIRATAQIGVIEVLEENGIPIDLISGCSSGAAVAGAYAAGNLEKLKKSVVDGSRRDYWRIIFEPTVPKKGFLKGERNRQWFEEFVGDKHFKDLDKKLILATTDIGAMKEEIIEHGPVSPAIQACTAVPGIFSPVKIDGKILVDGGNFNMIPSKVLYDHGADYVIGIYVSRPPNAITRFLSNFKKAKKQQDAICKFQDDCDKDLHIFQLIKRTINLSATLIKNLYHDAYDYDILIKPDLFKVKRWHINSAAYCIKQGRKTALEAIEQIKQDLKS